MSTWAAIAAKDTAATTALGNGVLHGISAGAIAGFAAGAMLTGLCFLAIVAPRSARRSRLTARLGAWPSFIRRPRPQRDYYAAPGDTYSLGAVDSLAADRLAAESETVFQAAPVAAVPLAERAADLPEEDLPEEDLTEAIRPEEAPEDAGAPADAYAEAASVMAAPVSFEAFAISPGYGVYASADPWAVEVAAASYAELARPGDDDVVLPADDQPRPEGGRSYRSKHRMTEQESADRRQDGRRAPKHAAPSGRLSSRMSSKLAMFPLVAARG
jgi:hypothetical protein